MNTLKAKTLRSTLYLGLSLSFALTTSLALSVQVQAQGQQEKIDPSGKKIALLGSVSLEKARYGKPENWLESKDKYGNNIVLSGSTFSVSLESPIDSNIASKGDTVAARLDNDLVVGGQIIAKAGSLIEGSIVAIEEARSILKSEFSAHNWMHSGASIAIQFNRIVMNDGRSINCQAAPVEGSKIIEEATERELPKGVDISVNKHDYISLVDHNTIKGDAVSAGIGAACLPTGPLAFAISPLANAFVGAAKPSLELRKAVSPDMKHPRFKGFVRGLVNGIPGSFLITDARSHGAQFDLKPGTKMLLDFTDNFDPYL